MPNRLWRYNLLQSLCRIVYCISENFDQNQCRWWQCRRTKWSFFHEIRAEVFIECITVANYVIMFYCLYWELSFKCAFSLYLLSNHAQFLYQYKLHQWASYQIRKFAGCTCAGNAGNVFSATGCKPLIGDSGMQRGTCVTHVPWYMSGSPTRGRSENVPDIRGACATRNFTYLAKGPYSVLTKCCSWSVNVNWPLWYIF